MTSPETPVEAAFALLREGRLVDAEELMAREVRAVTEAYGRGSAEWGSARCDLGNVLLNADQLDRAVECYRDATEATVPDDPDSRKDHLTYRLNLGTALQMAGRLDEAEVELRRGVDGRLEFYGRDHAGYAFGLEPLAEVLIRRGDARAARPVVEEAVENFWRHGHERVATALALRAEVVAADGSGDALFPHVDHLPDDMVEGMARSVLNRLGHTGPDVAKTVLGGLVTALEERLGADHQATLNALSALANFGHDHDDQAGRIEAIERVLASYDRQGRTADALMAALGLAMAHGDAGDTDAALGVYASAYGRAERIGRPELRSQVLRNWGLALKEAGQAGPAEQRLAEAVTSAREGADSEMLGRARIALGLFLQHEERLGDARAVIEEGLSDLDPVHPDAMIGRSHLDAVLAGQSCGCGNLAGTVEDAFRQFVLGRISSDLLADLSVRVEDGDFKINVELQREPTQEELERLNGVIQSAYAEFRRRLVTR